VIGIIFLGRFGLGAYYSFFSLYLHHTFGLSRSLLWAIGSLAEIPIVFFSGALIAKLGVRVLPVVSLAAISLRRGMFILAPSRPFWSSHWRSFFTPSLSGRFTRRALHT